MRKEWKVSRPGQDQPWKARWQQALWSTTAGHEQLHGPWLVASNLPVFQLAHKREAWQLGHPWSSVPGLQVAAFHFPIRPLTVS